MSRTSRLILILFATLSLSAPLTSVAAEGGDLECDARIKEIWANLEWWILNRGYEAKRFKLDLVSTFNPNTGDHYTREDYASAMLDIMRKPLNSSCVSEGDKHYPVDVDDSSKVCKSWLTDAGLTMICDRKLLLEMKPDPQIRQIHHEGVTNIQGMEPDDGPISSYLVSLQPSKTTEDVYPGHEAEQTDFYRRMSPFDVMLYKLKERVKGTHDLGTLMPARFYNEAIAREILETYFHP